MKLKIQSSQIRYILRLGLLSVALSVLLVSVWTSRQRTGQVSRAEPSQEDIAEFDSEFASFLKENGYGSGDLSRTLFMDSILSIIQNYYVEPSRASNEDLVLGVATVLSDELPDFHLVNRDGRRLLDIEGEQPLILPEKASYIDLLKFIFLLSKNLESYQKKHPNDFDRGSEPENLVLNAMLRGLDAHSTILDRDSYRDLRQGTEGSFGGLGVLVGMRSNILTVVKPIRHSPAEKAGIRKSDKIIAINNTRTFGQSLDELVGFMRGDPGTVVNMTVLRENQPAPVSYQLKREVIQVESVRTELVTKGDVKIAFIAIETFANRTAEEVHQALKSAREKFGGKMTGLVLDLRSNPGGLLDQAVQVADLFLKDGVIVSTEGRRNEIETAGKGYHEDDYPIALLVDGDTASASEIVAGALQDHDRAIVIGQQSFGKGSVQTIFELPGDRALKLTVARYYTPLHRSIQGSGIVPDLALSPVYPKARNLNLLGAGKYRTEGMLRNSLSREISVEQPAHSSPAFESVYLSDSEEEQDPQAGEIQNDYLRNLAENLISTVAKTYPSGIPPGARRSDHWLALAIPTLRQDMLKESDRATEFIQEKFGVDWTQGTRFSPQAKVDVQLKSSKFTVSTMPGTVSIPLTVTATGPERGHAARVSLLFKPRTDPIFESEILVGKVLVGQPKHLTLSLNVPVYDGLTRVTGSIYPVLDGQIQFDAGKKVVFDVKAERQSSLEPTIEFEDGESSIEPGVLDPGEKGFLRVKVRNESRVPLNAVKVELSNLSGAQVTLPQTKQEFAAIGHGETQEFRFPIQASGELVSSEIEIGVSIGTRDVGDLYRKSFVYKAGSRGDEARDEVAH